MRNRFCVLINRYNLLVWQFVCSVCGVSSTSLCVSTCSVACVCLCVLINGYSHVPIQMCIYVCSLSTNHRHFIIFACCVYLRARTYSVSPLMNECMLVFIATLFIYSSRERKWYYHLRRAAYSTVIWQADFPFNLPNRLCTMRSAHCTLIIEDGVLKWWRCMLLLRMQDCW